MSLRDVLCFSHLRWNFVFQRPNHLMSRFAREGRVLFIEEPQFDALAPTLERSELMPNLIRVVPHVPSGIDLDEAQQAMAPLLAELCSELQVRDPLHWFYTPMMLPLADGLACAATVYDCMDELSMFMHAPPQLLERERALMEKADVVFTGGMALYDLKRHKHHNVHGMPSSVDVPFFMQAREPQPEPTDQASIPRPRAGYCGVIDERLDLALLERLARDRPGLQIVMVGPVVKIDPDTLPRLPNIHYLGGKSYSELPAYLAGWDVAIMPFARNDATRFISPTKTPEFLAAGKVVVSTAITDVVEPYERLGLVRIGRDHAEFVRHVDAALADDGHSNEARDAYLATLSWDDTWQRMCDLIEDAVTGSRPTAELLADQPTQVASVAAAR